MLASQLIAPTLREIPAEAEVISHKLMLRAGMVRKSSSGIYTYLPLALRVLEKIKTIVREEMNRIDGQELLLPIVQPAELWQETGRWDVYGDEMFRLHDRHKRDFCLGPTHEEVVTDLIRGFVSSHRQLPLMVYQIQNKYRDERRPRFGLMRGREFIMKDMYSFHRDTVSLGQTYEKAYQAYERVFSRIGLSFRAVEADPGAIGGNTSHEFMVLADSGEAEVVFCHSCDYAANVEKATSSLAEVQQGDPLPLEELATPGVRSMDQVVAFTGLPLSRLIKTLVYLYDEGPVAVALRGDRQLNELKLQRQLAASWLRPAEAAEVAEATGSEPGSVGPCGLSIPLYLDPEVKGLVNAACGANRTGFHLVNVNYSRDFSGVEADLRLVQQGDACPRCGAPLDAARGIEVGQVFQLGTKYSEPLGAVYTDEEGREKPIVMGCYGIGVSRTMAAAIEQHHDEHGIIWPAAIAPYHAVVVVVNVRDEALMAIGRKVYNDLQAAGVEVVLDDRDERPGVKFKDADLIGYPLRVTVGRKALEGLADLKRRSGGEEISMAIDGLADAVLGVL